MTELQPLIDLLGGKSGALAQVAVFMGAMRILAKPISGWLQTAMTRCITFVRGTPETDDDAFLERVLSNRFYRMLAFIVDYTASIKLPTSSALKESQDVPIKTIVAVALLAIIAGCGTLDPAGVYQGDKAVYDADLVITTSYQVMHTFVAWELNNRERLASIPEIKVYADVVRKGAEGWISSAIALRDAYKQKPDDAGREALERALAVLAAAMRESTSHMAKSISQ